MRAHTSRGHPSSDAGPGLSSPGVREAPTRLLSQQRATFSLEEDDPTLRCVRWRDKGRTKVLLPSMQRHPKESKRKWPPYVEPTQPSPAYLSWFRSLVQRSFKSLIRTHSETRKDNGRGTQASSLLTRTGKGSKLCSASRGNYLRASSYLGSGADGMMKDRLKSGYCCQVLSVPEWMDSIITCACRRSSPDPHQGAPSENLTHLRSREHIAEWVCMCALVSWPPRIYSPD